MKTFGSDNGQSDELFPKFRIDENPVFSGGYSISQEVGDLVKSLEVIRRNPNVDQFSPRYFLKENGFECNILNVKYPVSGAVSTSSVISKLELESSISNPGMERQAQISNVVHECLLLITSNHDLRNNEVSEEFIFRREFQYLVQSTLNEKGIDLNNFSQDERKQIKNLILSVFRSLKRLGYDQIKDSQEMCASIGGGPGNTNLGVVYSLPDTFGQGNGGNYLIDFKRKFRPDSISLSLQFGMYAFVSDLIIGRKIDRLAVIKMNEGEGEIHYLTQMNLALFTEFMILYFDLVKNLNLPKRNRFNSSRTSQASFDFGGEVEIHPNIQLLRGILETFHKTCVWGSGGEVRK